MKKYTLKYLPVEGEIGMGDHYLLFSHGLKSGKRRLEETGQQFVIVPRWNLCHFTGKQGDKLALLTNPDDRKKVKLYLVSHSLSVGDLVWSDEERRILVIPDGEVREYDNVNRVVLHPNGEPAIDKGNKSVRVSGWANLSALTIYSFKVIGEISPIPPGIELDQEVDANQVEFTVAFPTDPENYKYVGERFFCETDLPKRIELKLGV
jgi:hypothetical protein